MRSSPEKIVTIYNIPALVNKAYLAAFTPSNIQAGFKSTGIYRFCRDIFYESALLHLNELIVLSLTRK